MRTHIRRVAAPVLAFSIAVLSAACDDDITRPDNRIAAHYDATTFTVETPTGTVDMIEEGAQLSLFFHDDASVTGYLFAPGGDDDGTDLDANLEGTWDVEGNTLILQTEADTFLRDATLTIGDNDLVYDEGGIRVVLSEDID